MAPRKRKVDKKTKPPKEVKSSLLEVAPFHITFPITLIHKEGKSTKHCYFQVIEHLNSYVTRLNLKPKDYKIEQTQPRNNEEA